MKTEYKALEPGATDERVRRVVDKAIRREGQARNIILDARGSGLSKDQAVLGIQRAMGNARGKVDQLTIIGDDFEVSN